MFEKLSKRLSGSIESSKDGSAGGAAAKSRRNGNGNNDDIGQVLV